MENLYDAGSERAVLAGMVQYGDESFVEVMDILTADSFGEVNNQVLFKCLAHVFEQDLKVDIPAILGAAEHLSLSENVNTEQELSYIKSLSEFHVEKDNVYSFAVQVKKYEFARHIKQIANKVCDNVDSITGAESINDIVSLIETPVNDFLMQEDSGEKPKLIGEGIMDHIKHRIENKCDIIGLPTPFPHWDAAIGGGLRRKCVDLISARPKTGKSLFAIETALHLAKMDIPVLLLDTEMDIEDQSDRILANVSEVPINEVATGKFEDDPEHLESVMDAGKRIESASFTYKNVTGKPFESILNVIKRWVLHTVGLDEDGNTKDCLVIYDYLKLMDSNSLKNIQEYQALGFQITSLHNLCVKLDIPCIALTQLNRDGETTESTSVMSGSDRIIWLCTSFTIFKKKSDEEVAEDGARNGNRKLVPIVARHGPGMNPGDYINVQMIGDRAKIKELNTRNQLLAGAEENDGVLNDSDLDNINDEIDQEETD